MVVAAATCGTSCGTRMAAMITGAMFAARQMGQTDHRRRFFIIGCSNLIRTSLATPCLAKLPASSQQSLERNERDLSYSELRHLDLGAACPNSRRSKGIA